MKNKKELILKGGVLMNRFKCAFLVVFLYLLVLLVLFFPIAIASGEGVRISNIPEFIISGQFWIFIGILGLIQFLMLYVPIKDSGEYKIKERHMAVPIITTSFIFGLLGLGIFLSIEAAIFGDNEMIFDEWEKLVLWIGILVLNWIFWVLIFRRHWIRTKEPKKFMQKTSKTIRKGSLLELIIAIPCHIIVRWRGDCSAPFFTFLAIIAGFAIALLSFGPGLYYAFLARKQVYKKGKNF